jgi:hypothetical protein
MTDACLLFHFRQSLNSFCRQASASRDGFKRNILIEQPLGYFIPLFLGAAFEL